MHSLLLLAALASAALAPLEEPTAALRERILGELGRPQAIPDLFRLFERRDEKGDLSEFPSVVQQASRSPKARPDVRALATEMAAETALARGDIPRAGRSLAGSAGDGGVERIRRRWSAAPFCAGTGAAG